MDLAANHLADLRASGLTDATIEACGFRTLTNPKDIGHALNWSGPARKLGACLDIPYYAPSGERMRWVNGHGEIPFVRLKPDNPRTDSDGRPRKYEQPKDSQSRVYFPPHTRADVLADPTLALLITEGEKKAASADQFGFRCIGLGGVWCFGVKCRRDERGRRTSPWELMPDLAAIVWAGRPVYIAFDSDAMQKENVLLAEFTLAELLKSKGATVRIVRLPPEGEQKNGLDDYLVRHGPEALQQLIDAATPPEEPKRIIPFDEPDNPHALATAFLARHTTAGDRLLRYHRGDWLEYGIGCYRVVATEDIRGRLTQFIRDVFVQLHLDAAKDSNKRKPVAKVTGRLVADTLLALHGMTYISSALDAPAWIDGARGPDPAHAIAVANGILDLSRIANEPRGCLHESSPRFFTQTVLPFAFDPIASRPERWIAFLSQLWPDDPQAIETLGEFMGYCLTADTSQQKILAIIGPKRSGKGTVARILKELVGTANVAGPTLGSLATNFGTSALLGKNVAIISDARLSGRSDSAVILEKLLSISGEDVLTVDRKHREPVTTKLTTRFVILSNELPKLADAAGAFAGRLIILSLTRSWFGHEDHQLFDQLKDEMPGIFLWAIEGWKRLQARGRFIQPESSATLMEDMENLSSPVGQFVKERCRVGHSSSVEVGELYREWKAWCERHGRKEPGTAETFGRDLRAAVPGLGKARPRTSSGRIFRYVGIELRAETEDEDDGFDLGHSGHSDLPMHALRKKEEQKDGIDGYIAAMPGRYDHGDHVSHHHLPPPAVLSNGSSHFGTCSKCGSRCAATCRICTTCLAAEESEASR